MQNKRRLAEKVLEYWFTLEFLGQDKYPQKELLDARGAARSLKSKIAKEVSGTLEKKATGTFGVENSARSGSRNGGGAASERKGAKAVFDFVELDFPADLYGAVRQEAEACRMKKWGNITVYIGKVRREACIRCIAEKLPFQNEEDKRPERSFDEIACVSLQLTPEGKYVRHSLSLSTIVWAMKQIKSCSGRLSECLEEGAYRAEVSELEGRFFPKEEGAEPDEEAGQTEPEKGLGQPEAGAAVTASDTTPQTFAPDAVSPAVFEAIYRWMEESYLKDNAKQPDGEGGAGQSRPYTPVLGISFQLFADGSARDREDDDNYLGLSHDYFSNDLKFLLNRIRDGEQEMPEELLDYICSTWEAANPSGEKHRIDLVHPSDREAFGRQVHEILHVKNAPLGKWPSRFSPAFMQQTAINLAIKKGKTPLFQENGEVFSVNGPPGTGKTTLLKEIIVSNIVERSALLAQYEDPEDAFERHSFLHGPKAGHAYSQYTRHWYSLKNEKIHDYSVLVTSCNNAAVENISKELPLGSGILKDLKPLEGDSQEAKAALSEVSGLFDFTRSLETECYEKKRVEYPDIYFTYYAQKLLQEKDAWGLVAASLGRRKNIRDFYQAVLWPMRWDFYLSNPAEERLENYRKARAQFLEQEKLVRGMQEELGRVCDLAVDKIRGRQERKRAQEAYEAASARSVDEKKERMRHLEALEKALSEQSGICEALLREQERAEQNRKALEAQKQEEEKKAAALRLEAFQVLQAVGKRPLFVGKAAYDQKLQYAKKAAEEYDRQAEAAEEKKREIGCALTEAEAGCNAAAARLSAAQRETAELQVKRAAWQREEEEAERQLQEKKQRMEAAEEACRIQEEQYEAARKALDDGMELNEEFLEALLSEDDQISTEAQVSNPWFSQRYNREREKLFFHAMKLNKAFLLASKSCRDNLTSLAHYWGLQPGDEKERIVFHQEDREACVGALYQTLFLLVPVISTTFASVGTFLRDVKEQGSIGTLIVDEAGQAQPQMAAGALYRSRRAVIVGDPKQVEPVVTDDLKLLKNAFDDEELKPYVFGKTVSVQSCADEGNAFGTYLDNQEHPDFPDWVGCPLLVHRRCISPMYEISNAVSYNGMMKQQTRPPRAELARTFLYEKSLWIQVRGREKGNRNHFVPEQAEQVCGMLETAFSRSEFPSLYIISPFTTVTAGMREYIRSFVKRNPHSAMAKCQGLAGWMSKNIGTVHTFQGKEANEVIFLLGCDGSRDAKGAVGWVNSNIVNVAATRAKYRLYIVGDARVWMENNNLRTAKNILDTYALRQIRRVLSDEELDEAGRAKKLREAAQGLPSALSFAAREEMPDGGSGDSGPFDIETDSFMTSLESCSFLKEPLTAEQLQKFGFSERAELEQKSPQIRKNLELGIRLFYFLRPVYAVNREFDASCCAILFCKAIELQMKECFREGLKCVLPDCEIRGRGKGRGRVKLSDARAEEFTLGTFPVIIKENSAALGRRMKQAGEAGYDSGWWEAFAGKLFSCTEKRNRCCHDSLFLWKDLSGLLADLFLKSKEPPGFPGLMEASETGRRLADGAGEKE